MKIFLLSCQFERSERGNEAVQTVAILAVAATVLLGLINVGRMVQERGREQMALVLAGGEKSGVSAVGSYSEGTDGDSGNEAPVAMRGKALNTSNAPGKSYGMGKAFDSAAPSGGTLSEPPLMTEPLSSPPEPGDPPLAEPIIDPPTGNMPTKQITVGKEPGSTDPKDPVTKEPVTKEPAKKEPAKKKPATKEPVEEDPMKKDPVTAAPIVKIPAAIPMSNSPTTTVSDPAITGGVSATPGVAASSGVNGAIGNGGQVGSTGGFGNTGFPGGGYSGGGNVGMGFPNSGFGNQGGYSPYGQNGAGYPGTGNPGDAYSNNGYGYGANEFGMQDSPSRINQSASKKKVSDSDALADEFEMSETSPKSRTNESGNRTKKLSNTSENSTASPIGNDELEIPQDQTSSSGFEQSSEPDMIDTTQDQISIIGVDRTQSGISRLKLAVGEQFDQIHVQAGDRRLAFKAPPAGFTSTIPLSDTLFPPGTRIVLYGITKKSQLAVNFEMPSADHSIAESKMAGEEVLDQEMAVAEEEI